MTNFDAIPSELRGFAQWVTWRLKPAKRKPSKLPWIALGTGPAASDNPDTWRTFDEAVEATYRDKTLAGIGFVFSADDPYCGIDLDDCIRNKAIEPRAASWIKKFASYAEVSPSGCGVKIWVRAKKNIDRCKRMVCWSDNAVGQIEVYDRLRFFAVTGNILPGYPQVVNERQAALDGLLAQLFAADVSAMLRCLEYLDEKCPESVSGQGGHDKALRAACECVRFGLNDVQAWTLMRWWSERKSGDESWSDRELEHKIKSAREKAKLEPERLVVIASNGHAPVIEHGQPTSDIACLDQRYDQISSGAYSAIPWPWPSLTTLTQALLPGTVTVLCSSPGHGKSLFVLQCALFWLSQGVKFLLYELEEDRPYHLMRALSILDGNSKLTDIEWSRENPDEVQAAVQAHRATIQKLSASIVARRTTRVPLASLATWVEQVAPSHRLLVIDPITAASTSASRFLDDAAFMEGIATVAVRTGCSMLVVTHPKLGRKGVPTMDDLAGGADYSRFSQTIMMLQRRDEDTEVQCATVFGVCRANVNRVLHLHKTRNANGSGRLIGFETGGRTLEFFERGVIIGD